MSKEGGLQLFDGIMLDDFESENAELKQKLASADGWTCFHCGEHFVTRTHALLHFGTPHTTAQPACLIKAEVGLVKYIRELESRLARYQEEDSDVLRSVSEQRVEQLNAIKCAEDLGYERGAKGYAKLAEASESLNLRVARLVDACTSVESAFVTQVGLDYNDTSHAAFVACREALSSESDNQWIRGHDANVIADASNYVRQNLQLYAGEDIANYLDCLTAELRSPETDLDHAMRER